jgi:hypothetical protein
MTKRDAHISMLTEGVQIERFLALSAALTGSDRLPREMAGDYLQRLAQDELVNRLLTVFQRILAGGNDVNAAIRQQILMAPEFELLARQIIMLWYLGELIGPDDKPVLGAKPTHHFRGVMWEMIHAHPLALSGGYFGYWKYPPEN